MKPLLAGLLLFLSGAVVAQDPPHWSFQPVKRPAVPKTATHPIDAFILAKLQPAGLNLSSPASRHQLIRRVTFDLIGLPPTPGDVKAFVEDSSPDAYEKVLDRLLASPQYGERWGRHWLDLARYADTNGYEHDEIRPNAWRYRDYVIRSFNEDKPFDRFIVEQLAGDEAFPNDPAANVATGFNLLGPDMTDSADQAQRRLNTLNDMTDTAGLVFLGMTIACARCHDHKFEPISQVDYFRLQAFFAAAEFRNNREVASPLERAKFDQGQQAYDQRTANLRSELAKLEQPVRAKLFEAKLSKLPVEAQAAHRTPAEKRDGGQLELVDQTAKKVAISEAEIEKALSKNELARLKELRQQLKGFEALKPAALPIAMALVDRKGPPPPTHLLERGELAHKSQVVEPGYPSILLKDRKPSPANVTELKHSSGRRLALANWIINRDNPLTARVMVNRLWQHHFGKGLVLTPSDFGVRGERPSHPELLDWLACELVEGGWKLKRLHKLMLLSNTYQQSSLATASALQHDPENRLFSRMNRLRLEGEAVRDSLLAVSGKLNLKMDGPGVLPPVAAEAIQGAKGGWVVSADPKDHVRRSVYLFVRRNLRHPFLEVFDLPDTNLSCPKRERSTTAPQALALLNAREAQEAATALAERLRNEAPGSEIERAYQLVLGRSPTVKEHERATGFLKQSPLSELGRALFNLNEFVYLD